MSGAVIFAHPRVPGDIFLEETAPNRSLPGIQSSDGRWYAPLDIILSNRRAYANDNDGWTTVRRQRRNRHRRSKPVVVAEATA
jgi:hypothetical protein